jgi:uncharacterized protein (TIGR00255 family)
MTGYATEKSVTSNGEVTCEIRTLNSRYLEIFLKLPQQLKSFEDHFKSIIRSHIDRAKVNMAITLIETESLPEMLAVNEGVVKMYGRLLEDMRQLAGVKEPVKLADFLQFKDLFMVSESGADESFVNTITELVEATTRKINQSRADEGENLRRDLLHRLGEIESLAGEIGGYARQNARQEFNRQFERLKGLVDENKLDRNRLEMEIAIISDRVDISEEVVRLDSHLGLFRENLEGGSPIGKKLNFILQEMHREANTMSSKNTMIEIGHRVVALKEEIERMREQVQNIE